jgi:hypothetical protein
MKKLAAALMILGLSGIASGEEVGPAWTCQIKGKMAGHSLGVGLSGSKLEGEGVILCSSLNGVQTEQAVKMKIEGIGLGIGYTEYGEVEIATANFGIASSPVALSGSFAMGPSAGLTLIEAGLDVGIAVRLSQAGGMSFELALLGKQGQGLEAKLQLQTFTLEALN